MNRHKIALPALVMTAWALSACHEVDSGSGSLRTETRTVGSFDSIDLQGMVRLEVAIGSPASLTVQGRGEVLQRLKTEVHDGTLYVSSQRRDWVSLGTSPRITLRVSIPQLVSLNLEGGNDVLLTGFNGGAAKLRLEGATRLRGVGAVQDLTVFKAGAGHADLKDLVADDAKVTVAGVGSVLVHPKNSLDATMNGVGAILYTGNPREVNTHMNGLGTIARGEEKDFDDADKQPHRRSHPGKPQPQHEQDESADDEPGIIT